VGNRVRYQQITWRRSTDGFGACRRVARRSLAICQFAPGAALAGEKDGVPEGERHY
jgi:hypothetical protein